MGTFVLVHGGWHGGWCWTRVTDRLRAAGHDVWTPTLTGMGERVHLLAESVDLATHVQDVVAVFEWERLTDAVLVGHSYAGAVVEGVADRVGDRVRHVAYLDAMVVEGGEAVFDALPDFRDAIVGMSSNGWSAPSFPPEFFGVTDPADNEWLSALLTPLPIACLTTPLALDGGAEGIPRTYIACVDPALGLDSMYDRARSNGWAYHEMATGHDAMVTDPDGLTAIIEPLAR